MVHFPPDIFVANVEKESEILLADEVSKSERDQYGKKFE